MSALVNNLLDMARIQSGEVKLRRQWQPVEEVVGSALDAAAAGARRPRVEVRLAPGLPLVRVRRTLIERVLYNLLENACKYTPPARVDHRVAPRVAERSSLRHGQRHGPGIPKGQESAIFEKFTRGERESATPGVGLGLAICRAIVEAHRRRDRGAHDNRTAARASCSRCRSARRRDAAPDPKSPSPDR